MSGWGILAAGLGGGANAVGNITAGMIDQERRLQSAQVLSDIEEQKQMRIAERLNQMGRANAVDDATGVVGKARLEAAGQAARQGNTIAQEGARGMIPVQVEQADALRPGKIADAEAVAKVATKADIERATALLPLEIKRAYALADAAGRASAAHRQSPGAELEAKLGIVEKTLGRQLNEQEKLGLLGLAKAQETDKVTTTDTQEDPATGSKREVKTESTVPRGARAKADEADPIKAAMDAARAKGGAPAPAAAAPKRGILPAATEPAADPITTLDERTLRQIAAIPGHKDQARAQAELERRAASTPEIDTTGIGFGG